VIEGTKPLRQVFTLVRRQRATFDDVWEAHRPRVWRLMARLAGSLEQADDLTQEVAVKAFAGYESFAGKSDAFTWLYRIAVNVAQRANERKHHPTIPLDSPEAGAAKSRVPSPEAAALAGALRSRVWAALDRLPEEYRTTLILQVYEELKYREIAAVLDVPIGTVKSRLHVAISQLQKELNEDAL
jgi:RNA polymerase sigma-70 factor (ECF subfamily)